MNSLTISPTNPRRFAFGESVRLRALGNASNETDGEGACRLARRGGINQGDEIVEEIMDFSRVLMPCGTRLHLNPFTTIVIEWRRPTAAAWGILSHA